MEGSQHDGYHVGSMLQDFAHCEKLGGTLAFEYDVKVFIHLLMVCFS
jgi:hypothetical protein